MAKIKEKAKERKIKNGKHIVTDNKRGKLIRIICDRNLPDSEIDRHLKRHK